MKERIYFVSEVTPLGGSDFLALVDLGFYESKEVRFTLNDVFISEEKMNEAQSIIHAETEGKNLMAFFRKENDVYSASVYIQTEGNKYTNLSDHLILGGAAEL